MAAPNVTRLLVLWLLSESALHGYEIKRILSDPGLQFWFAVEFGSIYSVLRFLEKHGHAARQAAEREGRRPVRTRYAITPKGRRYFADLLREAWRRPVRIGQPIDVALASLPELADEEVRTLSAERRRALEQQRARLDAARRSSPSPEMAIRAREALDAELRWLDAFMAWRSHSGR